MSALDFKINFADVGPEIAYVLLLGGEFKKTEGGRWWVASTASDLRRPTPCTWHFKCNAARDWLLREHAFQVVDEELVRDEQYAVHLAQQKSS